MGRPLPQIKFECILISCWKKFRGLSGCCMGNSRMCTYMAMQFFNSNLEFLNKHYLNLCCCIISGIRKRSQRNILKPVKCIRNAVNMAQSPIFPQILHFLSSVFMINVKVSLTIKRQIMLWTNAKLTMICLGNWPIGNSIAHISRHIVYTQHLAPVSSTDREKKRGLAGTDNSRKGKRRGTDFLEASTVLTYFVRS